MKVVHEWLKDYIGDSIPSAERIEELLTFHAFEIEGIEETGEHTVIDIDVLPNRSSDCLCHRGIAREIATLTGTPLAHDPLQRTPNLPSTNRIQVMIDDTHACPRFTAMLITGIEVKESPEWLKSRLAAIGQRSINNIVDATNYVMFALGQPLHAYDADLFPHESGEWEFGVRQAREGEVVALIAEGGKDEDRNVTLKGSELLIVDRSTDTPVGLAGVKGGRFAGVHEGTKNVIIEAAHFDPAHTRTTARGLGIVIEASKRFENEPSRELPLYAQQEIAELIAKIAGGTCEGIVDVYPERQIAIQVTVSPARANALLGLSLSPDEMKELLLRAGCTVEETAEGFLATGPWERTDLAIEEDFIEEIGRVHGYMHVESVVPDAAPLAEVNARHYYSERIRNVLTTRGFSEVITSSFRKKDEIQLANALASDKSYLRSSLKKNLVEALDKNSPFVDLLGTDAVRVFEFGTVFEKNGGGVTEHVSLGIGVRTKANGYSPKDDATLTEILKEVDAELGSAVSWDIEKGIAEVNLSELLSKLPVPTAYDAVTERTGVSYQPFSIYPFVSRDIALWVPEGTEAADVIAVLNEHAGALRVRTTLFDEFHKDGKVSYAFRLVFQSDEKTLTDEEVNAIMGSLYRQISGMGWETR